MASASSLAHFRSAEGGDRSLETIEMDPQYAEGLGFALGDVVRTPSPLLVSVRDGHSALLQVEIGLLHDLAYAKSVATEPATSDDWEILVSARGL